MSQMQSQVRSLDPQYDNGAGFTIGPLEQPTTKTFPGRERAGQPQSS